MGRTVTLVLVTAAGEVLGAAPPFRVPSPWLQEVGEVLAGARTALGLSVTVVRLLAVTGSQVSYLARVEQPPTGPLPTGRLEPVAIDLSGNPHRAAYAEIGGVLAGPQWARRVLGLPGDSPAEQVRTWNLSSIWRLSTPDAVVWLKEVPEFFAHEGAVLRWLARWQPGLAPHPLAVDHGRVLLADIAGQDRYHAPPAERLAVLAQLHQAQVAAVDAVPDLLALGVPDGRTAPMAARIRHTVLRFAAPELVEPLLGGLEQRLAELERCGIPDSLVHGDLHPGNVRGTPDRLLVLDWADSCLAHPGYDLLRMVEGLTAPEAAQLTAQWCRWWRTARPGCAPERALELLRTLSAVRNAATYAHFLEHIEPAEWVYHEADVPRWLNIAAASLHSTK